IRDMQARGERVAFVGDGLNDGPALAAADLGIAVGDANDLARSAAAVGLLQSGMASVDNALALTRRAGRILRQNLVWALLYNGLIIPAAIVGYVHPMLAAVAMAASSISVSLNALRASWLPRHMRQRWQATHAVDTAPPVQVASAAAGKWSGRGVGLGRAMQLQGEEVDCKKTVLTGRGATIQ